MKKQWNVKFVWNDNGSEREEEMQTDFITENEIQAFADNCGYGRVKIISYE